MCKKEYTVTRNYLAESLIDILPLPCRYRNDGCIFMSLLDEKQSHELNCNFRPFVCPLEDCGVPVVPSAVKDHFWIKHRDTPLIGVKHESKESYSFDFSLNDGDCDDDNAETFTLLQVPQWGLFIVTLSLYREVKACRDLKLRVCVVAVQTTQKAESFCYKIKVYSDEIRRFSYSAPMESLHDCNPCKNYQYSFSADWGSWNFSTCSIQIWEIS